MTTHVIELTRDVPNPDKDGRSKDWNRLPVVPAGTRFVVRSNTVLIKVSKDGGRTVSGYEHTNSRLGKEIVEASTQVEPVSSAEMMEVADCPWGEDVLRILVKMGKLKLADFEDVAKMPEGF